MYCETSLRFLEVNIASLCEGTVDCARFTNLNTQQATRYGESMHFQRQALSIGYFIVVVGCLRCSTQLRSKGSIF
jgi:hypothetical protein